MGTPNVTKPVDGPEFQLFVKFMREHPNVWSKVTCPERLSVAGPAALNGERNAYRDVVPFAKHLVETFPDRVLGHRLGRIPTSKAHMPDDGLLVDFIPAHCLHGGRCAAGRQPDAALLGLTGTSMAMRRQILKPGGGGRGTRAGGCTSLGDGPVTLADPAAQCAGLTARSRLRA